MEAAGYGWASSSLSSASVCCFLKSKETGSKRTLATVAEQMEAAGYDYPSVWEEMKRVGRN
ncbi:hypothetical protein T484DRAFT_1810239 [Baffinella frigidus]|nr:hypothetical protein T484DRAFT_1810239 [Cryptophyta sp. CCMP2293]